MTRRTWTEKLNAGALSAALLVAAAGLTAFAGQPADKEKELQGSFKEPLSEGQGQAAGGVSSHTVITSSEDDGTYKVEISNGKIKAWHNDKPLAKDRVRKSKDKVEILDKDGNVVHTFGLGGGAEGMAATPFAGGEGNRFYLRVPGGVGGGPDAGQPGQAPMGGMMMQAPPVMIGITMSDADGDAMGDKDFESGIMVDRVVEGLPADKSGIKPHDIIVEVEGTRPIDQEKFREILHNHKAGDEITVKVLREGKVSERRLKLEKFDAAKLGMEKKAEGEDGDVQQFEMQGLPDVLKLYGEGGKAQMDEARKAIEKALRELQENENLKPEKIRGQAQKALEQAMKALQEAQEKGQLQWQKFAEGGKGQNWIWSQKPGQLYTVPGQPAAPRGDGDTSRKLDRLGEQLERLNRRLDELERRLDERSHAK